MEPAVRLEQLSYDDLSRLEVEAFHDQSGISLVDMIKMRDARSVNEDGEVDIDPSKLPNIPMHKLDNTLLWLAVRRTSGNREISYERALSGHWDWQEAAEDPDPKGKTGPEQIGD